MGEEKHNQLIDSFLAEYNFHQIRASANISASDDSALIRCLCDESGFSFDNYSNFSVESIYKLLSDKSHRSFYSKCVVLYFLFDVFCAGDRDGSEDVFDFAVISAIPSQTVSFAQVCYLIDRDAFGAERFTDLCVQNVSHSVKMAIISKLIDLKQYVLALQYYYFSKVSGKDIEEKRVIVRLLAYNRKTYECLVFLREQGDDKKDLLKVLFECMIEMDSLKEFIQLTFTKEEETLVDEFEFPDEKSRVNYFRVRKNFKELNLSV